MTLKTLPLTILGVVAGEVLHLALALEHQQMVDYLVHEIAVVAHYDDAAGEVLQVFLQNLQRHDVEVVGGLVEHEEVGIPHQHGAQVELAPLAATQFIYIIILLLGGEEEILQQLRR